MYASVLTATIQGIDDAQVCVETDVSFGFPAFSIVGLPDTAIRESKDRIRTAIINSGMKFPDKRVTVNLSPAGIRKEGTHFDLPVAVSILEASGLIMTGASQGFAFLGELALDGSINAVKGALSMMLGMRSRGVENIVVPMGNAEEASLVKGVRVYLAAHLTDVAGHLNGKFELKECHTVDPMGESPGAVSGSSKGRPDVNYSIDYSEVIGHENAKRALTIAASAMHNILMIGPPGAGKSFLAKRIPTIMPPMSYDECLEVTKLYSAYDSLAGGRSLVRTRPFRSPDHTISPVALMGGGTNITAGEVTMAHMGVLFLDELPEFGRAAIEALRKPIENEQVTISRVSGKVTLPSKFLLAGAMNPCPCGYYGSEKNECTCTLPQIRRYRRKLSGPFLDRIDMAVTVAVPELGELRQKKKGQSSADMFTLVMNARGMQDQRFKDSDISYNSQMRGDALKDWCPLDKDSRQLLDHAFNHYNLSIRSYERILKVSRTIADMRLSDRIELEDISEAISYRFDSDFIA